MTHRSNFRPHPIPLLLLSLLLSLLLHPVNSGNLLRSQQFPVPNGAVPTETLLTDSASPTNIDDLGPVPIFRSDDGPATLEIISRTEDAVKLKWSPPTGTHPVMYNLLMDRVSVYSGTKTYFEETGLQPERCYTFQVSAFVNGRWTKFSQPKRVTSMQHSVDLGHIDQSIKAIRSNIKKSAQKRISGAPCLLDGRLERRVM